MNITGKTKVYALIGNPVSHSLSPIMQNYAFKERGINGTYVAFSVEEDELEEALKGMWALGISGANVTVPHKEGVIPFLENITPRSKLLGAVNTLIRGEKGYIGDNTDGQGLLMALAKEKNWSPREKEIVIFGAGGSARAVSISFALEGARNITIINRNIAKGQKIAQIINNSTQTDARAIGWDDINLETIITGSQGIINTTTLGMAPSIDQMVPVDPRWFQSGQLVVDLIYNPLETKLLKEAKNKGANTYNGLAMLAYQGALAFSLWTGQEPPFGIMLNRLKKKMQE